MPDFIYTVEGAEFLSHSPAFVDETDAEFWYIENCGWDQEEIKFGENFEFDGVKSIYVTDRFSPVAHIVKRAVLRTIKDR